ncbi:hypothetical protein V8F06_007794 [Rhypophila decipiens]
MSCASFIHKKSWLTGDIINEMFSRLVSFLPNWETVNSLMVSGPTTDRSKWKPRFDYEGLKAVLPINTGDHWSLAYLDCDDRESYFIDSHPRRQNATKARDIVGRFIPQFLPNRYQPSEDQELWDSWKLLAPPCAKQSTTYDCGVYIITAAFRCVCDIHDLQNAIDAPTVRQWLNASLNQGLQLRDLVGQGIAQARTQIIRQLLVLEPNSEHPDLAGMSKAKDPADSPGLWEEVDWINKQRLRVAVRKEWPTTVIKNRTEDDEQARVADINAKTLLNGLAALNQEMDAEIETLEEIDSWLEILLDSIGPSAAAGQAERKKYEASVRWAEDHREQIPGSIALCKEVQTKFHERIGELQRTVEFFDEVDRTINCKNAENVETVEDDEKVESSESSENAENGEDGEDVGDVNQVEVVVISLLSDDEDDED